MGLCTCVSHSSCVFIFILHGVYKITVGPRLRQQAADAFELAEPAGITSAVGNLKFCPLSTMNSTNSGFASHSARLGHGYVGLGLGFDSPESNGRTQIR